MTVVQGSVTVGGIRREIASRDRYRSNSVLRTITTREIDWRARYNCACFYAALLKDREKLNADLSERKRWVREAIDLIQEVVRDPASEEARGWALKDPDPKALWDYTGTSEASPEHLIELKTWKHHLGPHDHGPHNSTQSLDWRAQASPA